ncbi:MAG: LysR substrate-binding domain-containing protein [Salaquimonas sp.]
MRPTLRQLQYLIAVAETGKFGTAAKNLNVSQPSLSAMIADMEIELGVILVERGRQGALLTPIGEELVRRARMILSEVESLKTLASQQAGNLAGRLRLGVLPSIGPYLLPNATRQLHSLFPDLRLFVREARTLDLEQNLNDGKLDIVISSASDHTDVISEKLFDEQLWICVAPDHPLAVKKTEIELEELKGCEVLSLGYGFGLNTIAGNLAARSGAFISTEYEGTSLDAVRQMAAMGAGVAILPSLYATTEARRDPELIIRKINDPMAQRDVSLIWRKNSPLTENFKRLAMTLREVAQSILN